MKIGQVMRTRAAALGISEAEVARRVGISSRRFSYYVNDEREPEFDMLAKIAKALEWKSSQLIAAAEGDAPRARLRSVSVRGHVQAGDWREALEWPQDDWYEVPLPPDPRWPRASRFALEVRGPSMNRLFPDRSVIYCALFDDIGDEPKNGDRVVVERVNRDGLFEATVKEYVIDEDGRRWLWPRSTHPDHQQPIPLPEPPGQRGPQKIHRIALADRMENGIESLRIYARVTGSYKPE